MRVRQRYLPPGWYPGTAEQTLAAIGNMERALAREGEVGRDRDVGRPTMAREGEVRPAAAAAGPAIAGIVPHAGWEFSGTLALEVLSRISRGIDTMVIIGGHLGPADGILCAFEDAYDTPLGAIPADLELLAEMREALPVKEDRHADNTVEIQLPFVRHLFPGCRALGMRASPSREADRLGKALAAAARKLGRKISVAGSTDLTHYGASYGFTPAGSGEKALRWVTETNDRRFIESLLALDFDAALERSQRDRSACSAGGALAAMSFAREQGVQKGSLVRYMTSFEVRPAESFVGYAGVVYG